MTSEILTMHIVDETEGVFTPTGGRYYVSFRFFPSDLNSGSAKEFKDRSITPALLALANQRKIDRQHNTTQPKGRKEKKCLNQQTDQVEV